MNTSITQYLDRASGAIISPCERYRYVLWRRWADAAPVAFIGLNPSTADATQDDPTIRRCVGFARRFDAGGVVMLNLYAYRSTDPSVLAGLRDAAIGFGHDSIVGPWLAACRFSVAAWGCGGPNYDFGRRSAFVALAVLHHGGVYCLGRTQQGQPRHPLYLKKDAPLQVWRGSPKAVLS